MNRFKFCEPVFVDEARDAMIGVDIDMRRGTSVVYAVQQGAGGPIKIGTTADLQRRFAQLQSGSPLPLALLATMEGDRVVESTLHSRARLHRIRGEWFHPVGVVLEIVEEMRLAQPPNSGYSKRLERAVKETELAQPEWMRGLFERNRA